MARGRPGGGSRRGGRRLSVGTVPRAAAVAATAAAPCGPARLVSRSAGTTPKGEALAAETVQTPLEDSHCIAAAVGPDTDRQRLLPLLLEAGRGPGRPADPRRPRVRAGPGPGPGSHRRDPVTLPRPVGGRPGWPLESVPVGGGELASRALHEDPGPPTQPLPARPVCAAGKFDAGGMHDRALGGVGGRGRPLHPR